MKKIYFGKFFFGAACMGIGAFIGCQPRNFNVADAQNATAVDTSQKTGEATCKIELSSKSLYLVGLEKDLILGTATQFSLQDGLSSTAVKVEDASLDIKKLSLFDEESHLVPSPSGPSSLEKLRYYAIRVLITTKTTELAPGGFGAPPVKSVSVVTLCKAHEK